MEEKKKQTEPEACKVAKKCGGCQYQGIPYEKQLQDKQKAVRQLMQSFCKTTEITGMKGAAEKEAENGERSVVKIRKSRTDHRNGESVLLQK